MTIDFCFKKIKQGKKKYFDTFYDLTKNSVFYTALCIVKDRGVAEDIMQDAYISFLKRLDYIDENNNPKYYLITTAKNLALNYIKKDNHNVFTEDMDIYSLNAQDQSSPLLDYCKEQFSLDEWKIFSLTLIYGYSQTEVAKMLNQPLSTLNYTYKKLIKKAKEFYKKVYEAEK